MMVVVLHIIMLRHPTGILSRTCSLAPIASIARACDEMGTRTHRRCIAYAMSRNRALERAAHMMATSLPPTSHLYKLCRISPLLLRHISPKCLLSSFLSFISR